MRTLFDRKNFNSSSNGQVAARRVTRLIIKRLWFQRSQYLRALVLVTNGCAIFHVTSFPNRFQTISKPFPNRFQTVSKPFPNRFQTVSKPFPNRFLRNSISVPTRIVSRAHSLRESDHLVLGGRQRQHLLLHVAQQLHEGGVAGRHELVLAGRDGRHGGRHRLHLLLEVTVPLLLLGGGGGGVRPAPMAAPTLAETRF